MNHEEITTKKSAPEILKSPSPLLNPSITESLTVSETSTCKKHYSLRMSPLPKTEIEVKKEKNEPEKKEEPENLSKIEQENFVKETLFKSETILNNITSSTVEATPSYLTLNKEETKNTKENIEIKPTPCTEIPCLQKSLIKPDSHLEEDSGVESTSISKKQALEFFTTKLEEEIQRNCNKKEETHCTLPECQEPIFVKHEVHIPQPDKIKKEEISKNVSISLLEEFNIQPEPPPEMGFMPRTEIKTKDLSTRVKQLEEAHRDLSPVDIPGAVRIYPPSKSDSREPYEEKKEFPQIQQEIQEEPCIKEEICVAKDANLSGAGDWTVPKILQKESQELVQPDKDVSEIPLLSQEISFKDSPSERIVKESRLSHFEKSSVTSHSTIQKDLTNKDRPHTPKPSYEALQMEKLWAYRKTPEPEKQIISQNIIRPISPLRVSENIVKESNVNFEKSSVISKSTQQIDLTNKDRPHTPKPSSEALQMEKLWTYRKTPEPEQQLLSQNFTRPISPIPRVSENILKESTLSHFEKSSFITQQNELTNKERPHTPKPSSEALQIEKLWACRKTPEPEQPLFSQNIIRPISPMTFNQDSFNIKPSNDGIKMEKLWTPKTDSLRNTPVSFTHSQIERGASPKPSLDGLAMDKIWAHKHPGSILKKTWPPPEAELEKPVHPWVGKQTELEWPPPQESKTTEEMSKENSISTDYSFETIKQKYIPSEIIPPAVKDPTPLTKANDLLTKEDTTSSLISSHVSQSMEKFSIQESQDNILKTDTIIKRISPVSFSLEAKNILKSSEEKKIEDIRPSSNLQHYISESKVYHSSNIVESKVITETITSENMKTESEILKSTKIDQQLRDPSPPIVEENVLRPSLAKLSWPPGQKSQIETKESTISISKKEIKPKPKFTPLPQEIEQIPIEPGPPPEMGYAPPPERKTSYVETIEQGLEKDLVKKPSKHLPGAVRTIPPPPKEIVKALKIVKSSETISTTTKSFEKFPDLEPFPFKADPLKAVSPRLPPPPKPSKFIKGEFSHVSDYESDLETSQILPKWRAYDSDTEEFTYRKVCPPTIIKRVQRSKSTDPDPVPPSQFDQPPKFQGPPRPTIDLTANEKKQQLEQRISSKQTISKQVIQTQSSSKIIKKKEEKKKSPPVLKPGSPPEFINSDIAKSKPDSPKSKVKERPNFPDSGYMADTDEPRKQIIAEQQSTDQIIQTKQIQTKAHHYHHHRHEQKKIITSSTISSNQISSKPKKV